MRKKPIKTLDLPRPFDPTTVSRSELLQHVRFWKPAGSGPLGTMKHLCGAYAMIAELRGFEPFTYEEIYTRCETCFVSSRVCELGTRSCTVRHNGEQHDQGNLLDDGNDAVQAGPTQVGTDNG